MSKPLPILSPPSLAGAIRQLVELDNDQYKKLRDLVEGAQSFALDRSVVEDLAGSFSLTFEQVSYLLAGLSFLYERLEDLTESPEGKREVAVKSVIEELNIDVDADDQRNELVNRLLELLKHNDAHDRFKKIRRLESGFLPRALDFQSFVDLRPLFSKDRSQLEGCVRIVQLNFTLDAQVPPSESITIQFTPDDLRKLKQCLEDVEKKLEAAQSLSKTLN